MNRKLYLFGMLAMVLLLASCKKEKETGSDPFNISAGIENDGSKTLLDGFKVKWILGDKIRIYDGTSQDGVVFTSKTLSNDDQTANFTCNASESIAESGSYWAIYPETGSYNRGTGLFSFNMPDAQTYHSNNTPMLFPMVATASKNAKGSGVFFYFQHAFGVLKISATGNTPITSIELTDDNYYLSGNFTVSDDASTLSYVSDGSNTITMSVSNVTLTSTPTDFYFVLPAGSLSNGFTVKFKNGNDEVQTTSYSGAALKIKKATIHTATVDATVIPSFSVGNNVKVQFAPGNLQYRASDGKWQFAQNQWDFIGGGEINWGNGVDGWQIPDMSGTRITGNNTPLAGVTIYNNNGSVHVFSAPRETQSDWIDLFGWGTSGKHANEMLYDLYKPWSTTITSGMSQRMPYDCLNNNHAGVNYTRAYGPASGDISKANQWAWEANDIYEYGASTPSTDDWRTLSKDEWNYLITKNGGQNYGYAELTNHPFTHYYGSTKYLSGVVLLPDGFQNPAGLPAFNTNHSAYSNNQYTDAQWAQMEAAGAVFLPAAGLRNNEYLVGDASEPGHNHLMLEYWSTTNSGREKAWAFKTGFLGGGDFNGVGVVEENRFYGCSVRLVKNVSNK